MIGKKLAELRKARAITQEKLAERLSVSRQAVQKWETDSSMPDISKLIMISELFGVTSEELLGIKINERNNLRYPDEQIPYYEEMEDAFYVHLVHELQQSSEEGRDVEQLAGLFTEIHNLPNSRAKRDLAEIAFNMIDTTPQRIDYRYNEPSDYEEIMLLCDPINALKFDGTNIEDKIRGAWLGRIVGCNLGKPLEGMRLSTMIPGLKQCGNYPVHRYVRSEDITDTFKPHAFLTIDTVDREGAAPIDDDTTYTVMSSVLIERYGRNFKSEELAYLWTLLQVKNAYFTAEKVAYLNIVNGFRPPYTATYHNPYREWIGAQIRSDYYGYINPGDPGTAAEYAFRDARISHTKNGIYGAMYVAAMIARAAVNEDPEDIVSTGLHYVPKTSRLYEALSRILEDYRHGVSAKSWSERFHKEWDDEPFHNWCHVISNACIVTAAILYCGGDFLKSICFAVSEGFDTDCNGATVGSVVGMMRGSSVIPESWLQPFHGKLRTQLFEIGDVTFDEMIEKTLKHIENRK